MSLITSEMEILVMEKSLCACVGGGDSRKSICLDAAKSYTINF